MDLHSYFRQYTDDLSRIMQAFEATDLQGGPLSQREALELIQSRMKQAHRDGGRLIFIGNGGSASIASHLSFDYTKNGNMRAIAPTDATYLTGGANDLGYENFYAQWLEWHGRSEDISICISSSGKSQNILNAVEKAKSMGMFTFTLSAFRQDNPLRKLGDLNIWLDSGTVLYGHAENGHQVILHAILEHSFLNMNDVMASAEHKIKTPQELAAICSEARVNGKKIVHVHGVFDLIHPGHINHFEQAKALGDIVYVGLVADRFVRKGPNRPYFNEKNRLHWIAAMSAVDYVVLNEEEGPWSLMRLIRPDYYTKGESDRDKLNDPQHGLAEDKRLIESLGGQLAFIKEEVTVHSSDLFRALGLS
jgi:D-sedoheptulose 7-phosphate isomerase